MKIAYLILAHNNFDFLNKLVLDLKTNNSDIYIHIDQNCKDIYKNEDENIYIKSTHKIMWGGFSMVDATLDLIEFSKSNKIYDYYILLSGDSYPMLPKDEIEKTLKDKTESFMEASLMPTKSKPIERINKYYFQGAYRNKSCLGIIKRIFNESNKILPYTRKIPSKYKSIKFYGGSQWWIIHKDLMEYIMEFVKKNPEFYRFYKNTFIPDETFFQTIAMNSTFKNTIMENLVYTDWNLGEKPYPAKISEKNIKDLMNKVKNRKVIFARKFNQENLDMIKFIKKEYLNEN